MKLVRSTIVAALLLTLLAACAQPPAPPDPSMTSAPRAGGGQGNGNLGWVDPSVVGRGDAFDSGLEMRSDRFGGADQSGRLEGVLPSIYFEFDQSAVRPSERPALQEAADYLLENDDARLIIEGHADWRGTTEYNLALGERRAASARDYLLSLGIDSTRIEIVSMGDREAVQTDDESVMRTDRRADLIVIP
ncbi:MAG: OmpA family protein [Opitutales bacterium]